MTCEILIDLAGFALVSTGTPGSNNMMVMASGANHGCWRTVPHMLGIRAGLGTMLVAMGLGLGAAFGPSMDGALTRLDAIGFSLQLCEGSPTQPGHSDTPMTEAIGGTRESEIPMRITDEDIEMVFSGLVGASTLRMDGVTTDGDVVELRTMSGSTTRSGAAG